MCFQFSSVQFSSVAQSCTTLCDPMDHSTPSLPVHHQLPEFTQTHVHWVGDAIQPSRPLSSPFSPAPDPSQHQSLFQWVNSSHEVILLLPFQCRCFLFLLFIYLFWSNFSGWDIQYMSYQEIKEYSYEGLNKAGNSERLVEPWNQVSLQRLMIVNIILFLCSEWKNKSRVLRSLIRIHEVGFPGVYTLIVMVS